MTGYFGQRRTGRVCIQRQNQNQDARFVPKFTGRSGRYRVKVKITDKINVKGARLKDRRPLQTQMQQSRRDAGATKGNVTNKSTSTALS